MMRAPEFQRYTNSMTIEHELVLRLYTDHLISMYTTYIFTYSMYLYLNTLTNCGVLLHNDLLEFNYCDTNSPHNAMHHLIT